MRLSAIAATGILLLAACSNEAAEFGATGEASPSDTGEASPSESASTMTQPSVSVEPTATLGPTPTSTPRETPTATPQPTPVSAFAETDRCTNEEHGWTVVFPESWWTNTAFTHPDGNHVPACWMFSPDEFDAFAAEHANQTPPDVDVWLRWVPPPGLVGISGEVVDREPVTVSGYDGTRIVWRGTAEAETAMGPDDQMVQYSIGLPDDVDFLAFADSRHSDDFDHAVEVLDGMMERIELSAP
jgi:hypothetical protein